MTTAEMIKELCEQMNISVSELARRIAGEQGSRL